MVQLNTREKRPVTRNNNNNNNVIIIIINIIIIIDRMIKVERDSPFVPQPAGFPQCCQTGGTTHQK